MATTDQRLTNAIIQALRIDIDAQSPGGRYASLTAAAYASG
jgi:hypothetical protein